MTAAGVPQGSGVPDAGAPYAAGARDAARVPEAAESVPAVIEPRGGVIDWVLVGLITLLTAFTAVVAIAFLPVYVGSVPLPVSVLLGVAAMILAPRACYGLTGSLLAATAPVASWFAVSVWLVLARNPLINLPVSVYLAQWRVMLLLGLGSLAAAATVGLIWGDRLRGKIAAEQSMAGR